MNEERFQELVERYIRGAITEAEAQELAGHLESSKTAGARLLDQALLDCLLTSQIQGRTDMVRKVQAALLQEKDRQALAQRVVSNLRPLAPAAAREEARPAIHYGSESRGPEQERHGAARKLSMRRARREDGKPLSAWGALLAACLLAAATLAFYFVQRGPARTAASNNPPRPSSVAPPRTGQGLEAKEETARRAREAATRHETARREAELRLAEIERMKRELGGPASTDIPSRREALAALEAQGQAEESKLLEAIAAHENAGRDLARAEEDIGLAATQPAEIALQADEVGRLTFVSGARAEPPGAEGGTALVRVTAGQPQRLALVQDMRLLAGDRIETRVSAREAEGSGARGRDARPVLASVEFRSGATVDLADGTCLELTGGESAKLEQGLVYAEDLGDAAKAPAPGGTLAVGLKLKTAFAEVEAEAASFDLTADAKEAVLQVERGGAFFFNTHGKRQVRKLQRSVARAGFAPGLPLPTEAKNIWRGRKGGAGNLVLDGSFERGGEGWTEIHRMPLGTGNAGRTLVAAPIHSGKKSLQVAASATVSRDVDLKLPAEGGVSYDVEAWVKTEKLSGSGATLWLAWHDRTGKKLGGERLAKVAGTADWTLLSGTYAAPPGAATVFVVLLVFSDPTGQGTAWFDDVKVLLHLNP